MFQFVKVRQVWLRHCDEQEKQYASETNELQKQIAAKKEAMKQMEKDLSELDDSLKQCEDRRRSELNRQLMLDRQLLPRRVYYIISNLVSDCQRWFCRKVREGAAYYKNEIRLTSFVYDGMDHCIGRRVFLVN